MPVDCAQTGLQPEGNDHRAPKRSGPLKMNRLLYICTLFLFASYCTTHRSRVLLLVCLFNAARADGVLKRRALGWPYFIVKHQKQRALFLFGDDHDFVSLPVYQICEVVKETGGHFAGGT